MAGGMVEACNPSELYGYDMPNCEEFTVFDHYVNSCVPASLIQFADQENEPAMTIIYGYVLPLLSTAVLISHAIVICVLYEQKSRRATVEPLLWMAMCALMMAIAPLPFTIYYYNLGHLFDHNQTEFLCYLQKVSMEILPFFFNTLITFFTILLGTQRFIAIQYPLDSFQWCSRTKIRRYSQLILVLSLLMTIAHSMFDIRTIYHFCISSRMSANTVEDKRQPVPHFWVARCFVGYSSITRRIGAPYLSEIFDMFRIGITLVPSVVLFIITILLIRTVKATDQTFVVTDKNKNISTINRHRKITTSSRNTTVMLTVIIVLFLIGRMPSITLIILMKIADYVNITALEFVYDAYVRAFTNIIMMTVHPISFAVYMLMSRRFRVTLRKLFGCRCFATDDELRAFNSSMRIHSAGANQRHKDSAFPLINYKHESEGFSSCQMSRCSTARDGMAKKGVVFSDSLNPEDGLPLRSASNPIEMRRSISTNN